MGKGSETAGQEHSCSEGAAPEGLSEDTEDQCRALRGQQGLTGAAGPMPGVG